jgi:multiple sugar transport system substrate-binding protein
MYRRNLIALGAALTLALVACAAPAAQAPAVPAPAGEAAVTQAPAAEAPAGESTFITWYQYDENNTDPKSDERVGNEYLRKTIPLFNEEFKGRYQWVNQPQAWDKMRLSLIAAVQGGGEVPDLMQSSADDAVTVHYQNGTLQDLTEWAQAQPWYKSLDQGGLIACTGPDGKLYCIPTAEMPYIVFYWSDHFPNGYPKTPDAFLKAAAELKAKNVYAVTFFGSTDFDGEAGTRFFFMLVDSFGGGYDDGKGMMTLNTPENVKAIEFLREIVQKGYAPEVVFAGKFQEEEPMKTAEAASFPTGIFGYRYVNPLKAPNGKEYNTKTEKDMLDAIEAGDVKLSSFVAAEGHTPGCGLGVTGFVIPKGAGNPDGAKAYINWIMDQKNNAAWVQGPGGGVPTLAETRQDPLFQTEFYKQAIAASAGLCRPWAGSLANPPEAQKIITTAIYKLIKEDPTADIAAALQAAQDEYNTQFGPQS